MSKLHFIKMQILAMPFILLVMGAMGYVASFLILAPVIAPLVYVADYGGSFLLALIVYNSIGCGLCWAWRFISTTYPFGMKTDHLLVSALGQMILFFIITVEIGN